MIASTTSSNLSVFAMKRRYLSIDGMPIAMISATEAETRDVLVCIAWTTPPRLPDNQRASCGHCGCALQHRPYAPRRPLKLCMTCAMSYVRPN